MSCPCYLIAEAKYKELAQVSDNIPFRELRIAFDSVHRNVLPSVLQQACIDAICAELAAPPVSAATQALLDQLETFLAYAIFLADLQRNPALKQGPNGYGTTIGNGVFPFQPAEDYQRNSSISWWQTQVETARTSFLEWFAANVGDYPCYVADPCVTTPQPYIGVFGTAQAKSTTDCGCS